MYDCVQQEWKTYQLDNITTIRDLRNDVVPILFLSGTGGNFLSYYLRQAKIADTTNSLTARPNFTKHGSAHKMKRYYSPCTDPIKCNIEHHLNFIKEASVNPEEGLPFFFSIESPPSAKEMSKNFNKFVYIGYDEDDIDQISRVFFVKRCIDGVYFKDSEGNFVSSDGELTWNTDISKQYSAPEELFELFDSFAKYNVDTFKESQTLNNNGGLNISWKEYTAGDIDQFINKLSTFTGYRESSFDQEALVEWRKLTFDCISQFDKITSEFLGDNGQPKT